MGLIRDLFEQDLDIVGTPLTWKRLFDHPYVGRARVALLAHPVQQDPEEQCAGFNVVHGLPRKRATIGLDSSLTQTRSESAERCKHPLVFPSAVQRRGSQSARNLDPRGWP